MTTTRHPVPPSSDTLLQAPGEASFDTVRCGFQTHRPHRPAFAVEAHDAGEVAAAVRAAAGRGLRVAVQATGHGVGATDPASVLVGTAHLDRLSIDPVARVARVGAGVRWGRVVQAAAHHGLAPLSGSSPGVGVAGYTVHGGLPILGRAHGWAATRVRALDVVTADGEARHLDVRAAGALGGAETELAWALRGGGGSFAVVTELEIDLLPLASVLGGCVYVDAGRADEVLPAWRAYAEAAPASVSTSVAVVPIPDVEGPPPVLRGRTVLAVRVAVDAPDDEARRLVAPLQSLLAEPLAGGLRRLPWAESAAIHQDPAGPAASTGTTVALTGCDNDLLAEALVSRAALDRMGGVRRVLEVRRLGGALAGPEAGRAVGTGEPLPVRRDVEWTLGTVNVLPPPGGRVSGPARDDLVAAAGRADAALRRTVVRHDVGRLPTFLLGEGADPVAVRSAWSTADWERLRAVKRLVDPQGLFVGSATVPA